MAFAQVTNLIPVVTAYFVLADNKWSDEAFHAVHLERSDRKGSKPNGLFEDLIPTCVDSQTTNVSYQPISPTISTVVFRSVVSRLSPSYSEQIVG